MGCLIAKHDVRLERCGDRKEFIESRQGPLDEHAEHRSHPVLTRHGPPFRNDLGPNIGVRHFRRRWQRRDREPVSFNDRRQLSLDREVHLMSRITCRACPPDKR